VLAGHCGDPTRRFAFSHRRMHITASFRSDLAAVLAETGYDRPVIWARSSQPLDFGP